MSATYLRTRVLQALATIVLVLMANFLLFRVLPGDPERILLSDPRLGADAATLQAQRAAWGLDKPLVPDQLVAYVAATFRGDLGRSFEYGGQQVVDVIAGRLPATLLLVGTAQLVGTLLGIGVGAIAGWRRGTMIDHVGTSGALILYATPAFWLGMVLLLIFAVSLRWFPVAGLMTAGTAGVSLLDRAWDVGSHLVLPAATLSMGMLGSNALIMRSSLIDTLSEDYMVTARAKGLTGMQLLRRHAMPNALMPVVTVVALQLGYTVAGAVTTEVVFSWPGIGSLTVGALSARDYPVLQGVFLLLSISVVIANFAADLLYGVLDPRVRA